MEMGQMGLGLGTNFASMWQGKIGIKGLYEGAASISGPAFILGFLLT